MTEGSRNMRFLPAGQDGLLVELPDLPAALALLDALLAARLPGLRDIIPGARTVLLRFDPLQVTAAALADQLCALRVGQALARAGQVFDVPVHYDGEDLAEVATHLGWSVAELIGRHTDALYTVAFTGFAPGFAYMTCDDPDIVVPRRKSPRVRIPAGSVALAGEFGGIYPSDSPGGWQLLGRTPLRMWDLARERPALLAPGDRVRFRDMAKGATVAVDPAPPAPVTPAGEPALTITRADRPALFQDHGRPGLAGQGLSQSGAADRASLHALNRCLGNPRDMAAVEIAFGGFACRANQPVTVAVSGAPCPLTVSGPKGDWHPPIGRAFAMDAGDELRLGLPARGVYSYLGLRGGFGVDPVLGSASCDTLARLGPLPLQPGDALVAAHRHALAVDPLPPAAAPLPAAGETVTLDIVPGPRDDWFTPQGIDTFLTQLWQVTPESSRVGKRLQGDRRIERRDDAELASEATVPGAIQIPHSGQPVLFLADHPLTGGYPVIAVVAAHHLDLAAQLPAGAQVRFTPIPASFTRVEP